VLRDGSENFCDSPETGEAVQFKSYDSMWTSCADFCGGGASQGALPVVVGSEAFGLNLQATTDICTSEELLSKKYSHEEHKSCTQESQAFDRIADATVQFVTEMRSFSYTLLRDIEPRSRMRLPR
jgi:hypothetical protein